jgi:hypothetical protein
VGFRNLEPSAVLGPRRTPRCGRFSPASPGRRAPRSLKMESPTTVFRNSPAPRLRLDAAHACATPANGVLRRLKVRELPSFRSPAVLEDSGRAHEITAYRGAAPRVTEPLMPRGPPSAVGAKSAGRDAGRGARGPPPERREAAGWPPSGNRASTTRPHGRSRSSRAAPAPGGGGADGCVRPASPSPSSGAASAPPTQRPPAAPRGYRRLLHRRSLASRKRNRAPVGRLAAAGASPQPHPKALLRRRSARQRAAGLPSTLEDNSHREDAPESSLRAVRSDCPVPIKATAF